LDTDKPSYNGPCPVRINFTGTIFADGPGTVTYRFIRSDGATSGAKSLTFEERGGKTVSESWTLGGSALSSYEGWVRLENITPQLSQSVQASFKMTCRQADDFNAGRRADDQQDLKLTAFDVTLSTVSGMASSRDGVSVQVQAGGKSIGSATISRWMRNRGSATVKLARPLPLSQCQGLVLKTSLSSISEARGAPSFALASATEGLSALTPSTYFGAWLVQASVTGRLSNGNSVVLLKPSGKYKPADLEIPLNCPSP
jgi:hypothetical protein